MLRGELGLEAGFSAKLMRGAAAQPVGAMVSFPCRVAVEWDRHRLPAWNDYKAAPKKKAPLSGAFGTIRNSGLLAPACHEADGTKVQLARERAAISVRY